MARFDVYRNPDGADCLLNIQADLLSHLNTRVVVTLLPLSNAPQPARTLNPCFDIAECAEAGQVLPGQRGFASKDVGQRTIYRIAPTLIQLIKQTDSDMFPSK